MIRKMVCSGKGVGQMNIVKTLNDPDTASVSLSSEPAEQGDVLLELGVAKLLRFRVSRQFQQRSEGVTTPEKQRIDALRCKHIKVTDPECFVVEERKILRRVGIIIFSAFISDFRLLHSDTKSTQFQRGMVFVIKNRG